MLVNGEFVDDGLVRVEAARVKEFMRGQSPGIDPLALELQAREVARERIIEQTVLRQEAHKDLTPIPAQAIDAEIQRHDAQNPQQAGCLLPRDRETLRAEIEADVRVQRLIALVTANVPKPTAKQVSAMYQYTKDTLVRPENIHAAHIVKNVDEANPEIEARGAIERIQALLEQGEPFEQVADEHSDCPGRGGDLGFFARGQMVEEFDAHVFDVPAGKVSPIFQTPFGFHIAKVYERRAQRIPSLSEVRAELEDAMWLEEKQQAVRVYTQEARARAEVRKSK
jgi:parvulin-like peptidyl-prolyl isomerase